MRRSSLRASGLLPLCLVVLLLLGVQGWEEGSLLTVHVVPHSHNDPGWWYTFEDYYQRWTKGILTSVVKVLNEESSRTFIWAEISYFQRWWDDQPTDIRDTVKRLVRDGQLEFVTAGWVMNDEANTHVVDILAQLTEGHRWLHATLATKPNYGWAIDPFGHSPTMPNILQQMDFQGIVINRAHRDLKEDFRNKKSLEFMWHGDNLNASASFNMLTHMLPWKLYDIPNTCGPDWDTCASFDFEREVAVPITPNNVAERSRTLVHMYKEKAKLFRHNSVLIPLGDDFKYKTEEMTRKIMTQYEMLFEYINDHKEELGVNIKFSTLGQYFSDLKKYKKEQELPSYHGDFFTYCDEGQDYWSGYFTTRPFMKGLTRSTESILRTGEVLAALAQARAESESGSGSVLGSGASSKDWHRRLESARRNVGLFQHHDGVTGTARLEVVRDYSKRLYDSLSEVAEMSSDLALYLVADSNSAAEKLTWTTDPSNASPRVLEVTNSEGVVVIFNSLAHSRAEIVTLVVDNHNVAVVDGEGEKVAAQIDPVWEETKPSSKKFILHFLAEVKGIGLNTYFIKPVSNHASLASVVEYVPDPNANKQILDGWNYNSELLSEGNDLSIENTEYRVHLSGHGLVKKMVRLAGAGNKEQVRVQIDQSFLSYSSSGGAYLFRPQGSARSLNLNTRFVRVTTGPLVSTVTTTIDSSIKESIVRLYECYPKDLGDQKDRLPCPQSLGAELLHTVHLTDGNTEIVTRFNTDLSTGGRFYTDSNGLDMRERHYASTLPIQGNYYPITSSVYIESRENKGRLTALSHQAHGATSLKDGELEIMLDRRLISDDHRGLGEPITDNVRTLIPLWLVVESTPASAQDPHVHPALTQTASDVWHARNYPLHPMHAKISPSSSTEVYTRWAEHHKLQVVPLEEGFPRQLQLLTLAPHLDSSSILRLYRPPVVDDGNKIGAINVNHLFGEYSISSLKETSLSALNSRSNSQLDEVQLEPAAIVTAVIHLKASPFKLTHDNGRQKADKPITNIEDDVTKDVAEKFSGKEEETQKDVNKGTEETEFDGVGPAADETELIIPKKDNNNNNDANVNDHPAVGIEPNKEKEREREKEKERLMEQGRAKERERVKESARESQKERENADGQRRKDDIVRKINSRASRPASTSGLYTMSIVFYLTLLGVVLVGGWLLKKKRSNKSSSSLSSSLSSPPSSSSARVPNVWREREDSMMKLL